MLFAPDAQIELENLCLRTKGVRALLTLRQSSTRVEARDLLVDVSPQRSTVPEHEREHLAAPSKRQEKELLEAIDALRTQMRKEFPPPAPCACGGSHAPAPFDRVFGDALFRRVEKGVYATSLGFHGV